jgi:ArsR family transcriptional regulator
MDSPAPFDPLRCFKALADSTRLRLMQIARHFELSVNEIVDIMAMGQSRISRHLKILAEAGLMRARRDGLWTFYAAADTREAARLLEAIASLLDGRGEFAADRKRAARLLADRTLASRRFFDTVAEDWGEMKRRIIGEASLDRMIAKHLPPCEVVADLGCGSGDLLEMLQRHAKLVIGVDRSPRMLREARQRFSHAASPVELRLGELEHLPLREAEADAAVINMVLHHLPEPEKGIAEAHRVLPPGGTLLVVDLRAHHDESLRTRYHDRWLGFEETAVEDWLGRLGFRVTARAALPLEHGLHSFLLRGTKIKANAPKHHQGGRNEKRRSPKRKPQYPGA